MRGTKCKRRATVGREDKNGYSEGGKGEVRRGKGEVRGGGERGARWEEREEQEGGVKLV